MESPIASDFFVNDTGVGFTTMGSGVLNATPMALFNAVGVATDHRNHVSGMEGTATTLNVWQGMPSPEGPSTPPQWEDGLRRRNPLYVIIPIIITYAIILLAGIVGNVSTCIVIAKNKHMHTATNYYLFNLAISDLLLLVSGLPTEMYLTWNPYPYVFGEAFCVVQSFAAETSANATVLTITAFTVERYVAICHPLRSHTFSGLSRAVKLVVASWVLAVCLAVPQAIQFGIVYVRDRTTDRLIEESAQCTVKRVFVNHAFAISTCVVFVAPMTLITALYVLIGLRLRSSRLLTRRASRGSVKEQRKAGGKPSQNHVIRMLVAVVVAFFICWAPFHAQRLLAVYADTKEEPSDIMVTVYYTLTYTSGILYYLSTTVNPVLYNIMSLKFRDAFKGTLVQCCGGRKFSFKSKHSELPHRQIDSWKNTPITRTYSSSLPSHSERHKGSIYSQARFVDHSDNKTGQTPRTRLVTVRCANSTRPSNLHSHSYFFHGQERDKTNRSPLSPGAQKIEMYDISAEEVVVYLEGEKNPVEVVLLPSTSPTRLYPKAPSPLSSSSSEDSAGSSRRAKVSQDDDGAKNASEDAVVDYAPVGKCNTDVAKETRGGI